LALYNFDFANNCFAPLTRITQSYSHFIKCAQFFVLEDAYTAGAAAAAWEQDFNQAIKKFMQKYFHHDSQTALGEILILRAYGFSISKQESSDSNYVTPGPGGYLIYRKISISADYIQQLIQGVIFRVIQVISETLCLDPKIFGEI
jgi:hypothetical protein